MNKDIQLNISMEFPAFIQGAKRALTLSMERTGDVYYTSIKTDTGFDLCGCSYGYFKSYIKANTRLKSEKSIISEMIDIADNYIDNVHRYSFDMLIWPMTVSAKISGLKCFVPCASDSLRCFPASNIHSNKSKGVISWYEHDVYNQGHIQLEFIRDNSGAPRFYANENDLYDYAKLIKLYESDNFQNSNYAFFFYNEVRRLLGKPVLGHPKRMSGLFNQGIQE